MAPIAQPFDQVSGIVSVFDLERSLFYTKISSDSEITATQYNFSRTVYRQETLSFHNTLERPDEPMRPIPLFGGKNS